MNRNQLYILLFVTIIPFIGYLFNPLLAYGDSYAFLGGACGINSSFVIPFVPCNIFVIKLILLCLYVVSIFAIAKFGESVVGEKLGWRVGLYSAALTPLLFQEALKFENDIFGWSLAFVGLMLIGIGVKETNVRDKAEYMFLGIVAILFSSLAWEGTLLLLFAMSLSVFFLLVLSIPIFLIKFNMLIGYLLNNFTNANPISEEVIGAGMIPMMFLFPAILDIPKKWKLTGWVLFVIGFIKIKYMLFAIPFLALGMVKFEEKYSNIKHFPNLIYIAITFSVVFSFMGLWTAPTLEQFDNIDNAFLLAEDLNVPIYNDWSYGWWIKYLGHDTNFVSSYPDPDYNNLSRPYVAISSIDLNCEVFLDGRPAVFIC